MQRVERVRKRQLSYLSYKICRWRWKEPVVMCGNLNVRQATSQQVFKVTIFCMDTHFQSFSPLINRIIHHALLHLARVSTSRCRNSSVSRIGTGYTRSCIMPQMGQFTGFRSGLLAGHIWLTTCQGQWTLVSHSAKARLCHQRDVLVHCLVR